MGTIVRKMMYVLKSSPRSTHLTLEKALAAREPSCENKTKQCLFIKINPLY